MKIKLDEEFELKMRPHNKSSNLSSLQTLKMKLSIIVFLILCNGLVYSQDAGIQLPDSLGGPFVYKVSKDRIIKMLEAFEKYSLEELNTNSKWWYHRTVSSCKLYLDRDSSLYHFNEAFKLKPKATCESLRTRHNYFIKAIEESEKSGIEDGYIKIIKEETGDSLFSWYLWDLPDFDEFAFIELCNQKYPIKITEPSVKDSTLNSEIIRRRDQKYRSIGELTKQHELDQINRDFIDSLYTLESSLNEYHADAIYQISMVAHHSEDCDWTYKWLERLIDLSMNGYAGQIFLGPCIKRMFSPNDGFCTLQDSEKRNIFIEMIKLRHPNFFKKMRMNW